MWRERWSVERPAPPPEVTRAPTPPPGRARPGSAPEVTASRRASGTVSAAVDGEGRQGGRTSTSRRVAGPSRGLGPPGRSEFGICFCLWPASLKLTALEHLSAPPRRCCVGRKTAGRQVPCGSQRHPLPHLQAPLVYAYVFCFMLTFTPNLKPCILLIPGNSLTLNSNWGAF